MYEDELDSKVMNMMRKIRFMPDIGLGKNQNGPLEFVERKVLILKYGVEYHRDDDFEEGNKVGIESGKEKPRTELKKESLWETFVNEGTRYPYEGALNPLMIVKKLVPGFDIFIEHLNGIKEVVIEEPIVEELVLTPESGEDIPAMKLKDIADLKKELNFESYVIESIMDVFYNDLDVSFPHLFETDDLFCWVL